MAEETLVKEPLTPELIAAGSELLRYLSNAGVDITASLWFYIPEANQWRLILAIPDVDVYGPKKVYARVYGKIQGLLKLSPPKVGPLHFQEITILSPEHPLIKSLRSAVVFHGEGRIRFSRNTINNMYIEDALIYKL